MPMIKIEMWEGKTKVQKKELVEVLSKETARIAACDIDAVHIIIKEISKDNWAIGGQLSSDRYPE